MQIIDAQIHLWGAGLASNLSHRQVTAFTAEDAGVPIAALATDSLTELGRIAERHPGLRLTIDHLGGRGGTSTLKDAAAMTHMPELSAMAKLPNVAVKATGVPHYSSEAYPFPALHPFLRQVYDAFGPNRM